MPADRIFKNSLLPARVITPRLALYPIAGKSLPVPAGPAPTGFSPFFAEEPATVILSKACLSHARRESAGSCYIYRYMPYVFMYFFANHWRNASPLFPTCALSSEL